MEQNIEKVYVQKKNSKNFTIRVFCTILGFLLAFICIMYAKHISRIVPFATVIGTGIALILIMIFTYRLPIHLCLLSILFCIAANGLGSIVGLYKMFALYDNIIHYISGILLSAIGYYVIGMIAEKQQVHLTFFIHIIFTLFFGIACAGLWEIYEFSVDQLLNLSMQGNNIDTMSDIVAGSLGAITFSIVKNVFHKKQSV